MTKWMNEILTMAKNDDNLNRKMAIFQIISPFYTQIKVLFSLKMNANL